MNNSPKMRLDIITLFPELIEPYFNTLPYKRALQNGSLEAELWQLRDFTTDNYHTVDDKPYGGGKGMILMIEPIYKALAKIFSEEPIEHISKLKKTNSKKKVILLSPAGKVHTHEYAGNLAGMDHLVFICGRYEGVDHRVGDYLATDIISIGNFVLSGGEVAALAIIESAIRLLPGVLDSETTSIESFENNSIEYPQYTRPPEFKGLKVPDILLSGNHAEIQKWRDDMSVKLEG